ncbi:MAG: PqqD family protein [Candidatus Firestonebacteria bacterium]
MNEKLKRVAMNENGFIFDPQTGISYTANSTGIEILKKLKETNNIDKIRDRLAQEFEVSKEEAERDIIDFLELLKIKGFVE